MRTESFQLKPLRADRQEGAAQTPARPSLESKLQVLRPCTDNPVAVACGTLMVANIVASGCSFGLGIAGIAKFCAAESLTHSSKVWGAVGFANAFISPFNGIFTSMGCGSAAYAAKSWDSINEYGEYDEREKLIKNPEKMERQ